MSAHLSAEILSRYLNAELSEAEAARVESHVEECAACWHQLTVIGAQDVQRQVASTRTAKSQDAQLRTEIAAQQTDEIRTDATWTPEKASSETSGGTPSASGYLPEPGDLPPLFDQGRYAIQRRLGRGGMGAVYLARDTRLDRPVAIKTPVLGGKDDANTLQRFQTEAVALARLHLHHPNLCMIYDAATCDGLPYLTMRYIEGESLRHRLDAYRGRAGVALVQTLARALHVVHAAGIIHRDVKPENIIIDPRGQPVLVDFGLAQRVDSVQQANVEGTLAYMAPEQHDEFHQPGPASDIFSLGVILFELLAGQRPFQGLLLELLQKKLAGLYPPLNTFGVEPALASLCERALHKDPSSRFGSMIEFADGLAEYLSDDAADVPVAPAVGGGHATSTPTYPINPRVAEEVLQLLREWGWEVGLARLEGRIHLEPDLRRRGLLKLLAGWIKGERGEHAAGIEQFQQAAQIPEMRGWACAGQAFIRYRTDQFDEAWRLLGRAEEDAASDMILHATIDHVRGAIRYRQARDDDALTYLYRAAERFGPDHFGFGRVLDTLGMIYAARNNFPSAFALFQRALSSKQQHEDLLGQALTHGQLGRLLLDWGEVDRAEKEFRADLELCLRTSDSRGEAQMFNHLGQVCLARGQAARALEYLNESVARCQAIGFAPGEGYARKDRARTLVLLGRTAEAAEDAREAERLAQHHPTIAFHARRALALALAAQGKTAEAEQMLRQAAAFFRDRQEPAEAARTFLELARVQRRRAGIVVETLRTALEQADASRRDVLVGEIERELGEVDPQELLRRAYRRASGIDLAEDGGTLNRTSRENATAIRFDLVHSTASNQDARLPQMTLNQIFADLAVVALRQGVVVQQYVGEGFLALARGEDHARRAVATARQMRDIVTAFNQPRRLLGEPVFEVSIGIATGDVMLGAIGDQRKLDFTAVGPTPGLAAQLAANAPVGAICINAETHADVQGEFKFVSDEGRPVGVRGLGEVRVWEIDA